MACVVEEEMCRKIEQDESSFSHASLNSCKKTTRIISKYLECVRMLWYFPDYLIILLAIIIVKITDQ
jgi:hypothetical protein